MKTYRILLALALAATALTAHHALAQAPAAPPAATVPDAATLAREKAAAEALRAAVAAAATNPPGRTLPKALNPPATTATPTAPTAPATPPAPGATRPATPPFPTLPAPGAVTPGANTNRPGAGIQFRPAGGAAGPAGPAPGPGAIAPGTAAAGVAAGPGAATNLTLGQLRAVGTNAPGAVDEEVFPPGLIKFSEADLSQVLDIYQELTGRTLIKAPALPPAKITVKSQTPLTRSEAINALDTLLAMHQIATTFQGTKFIKVVPAAGAAQEAEKFSNIPWELLPEAAKIVTHIVQLKNALPNDVQSVIQPFAKLPQSIITVPSTSMLVLRDYAENVKRMLEMIEKVDVVPVQEFIDVVIPIKYALVTDIANAIGQLTQGGGVASSIGAQPSRTGLSTGGGFGAGQSGFGRTGAYGGGYPGQPGYNPLYPQTVGYGTGAGSTLGAGGAAGRSSFAQRLNQIVNRAATGTGTGDIFVLGQTKIIPDERTNSLLIFASRQDLVTISNIIEKLDVVLAQVVIEAAVIEVNLNNNLDVGFNYIQTQPTTIGDVFTGGGAIRTIPFLNLGNIFGSGGGTNATIGEGFTYAAKFMNFDAAVTAIAGDGRGKVLQRPRIQTSHAVEANLFVGQSRPYPSSYSGGGGLYGAYNQIQQLQIGVTLQVLPLVNYDGMVVMDIRQKVESYDGDVDIANVGKVPITSQKEANAKVAVRDRETVMLGGFISNSKQKSHGGVPILKDIPGLGFFFRSTKETEDRRELIVLIRPTVLPTPDQAAAFAKQERARLPGTKEAEYDFNESERKLLEETDKRLENKSNIYKREGFTR